MKKLLTLIVLFISIIIVFNFSLSTNDSKKRSISMVCSRGDLKKNDTISEFDFKYENGKIETLNIYGTIITGGKQKHDFESYEELYRTLSEKYSGSNGILVTYRLDGHTVYFEKKLISKKKTLTI